MLFLRNSFPWFTVLEKLFWDVANMNISFFDTAPKRYELPSCVLIGRSCTHP